MGYGVRKAEVLSSLDQEILWSMGILGIDEPEQLLNTVVFTIGLSCALRAGQEHRKMRSIPFNSQFSWEIGDNRLYYIRYTEDLTSKSNHGGLKLRKVSPKVINIHAIPGGGRCPVQILVKCFSMLPEGRQCTSLYLQPKKKFTPNCWYVDKPVGINKLQSVVHEMCLKAGLPGHYTNHSLGATAATCLYHNNFDGQVIQEITGHHSVAVREYKRTSNDQKRIASTCVMGEMT